MTCSLDTLAGLGAEIVDITLPFRFIECVAAHAMVQAESHFFNGPLAEDPSAQLGDAVRKRGACRRPPPSRAGLSRQPQAAARPSRRMAQALAGVDALLTPTTETAAIPLAEVDEDKVPSRSAFRQPCVELCALALPNGATASGSPPSLQIVCRGDEAMALRIGHAYQQATGSASTDAGLTGLQDEE